MRRRKSRSCACPFDDKDRKQVPEDGWRGTITTSPGADPAALLVHAICIKPI